MELDAYRNMAATEDGHWWFCGRRSDRRSRHPRGSACRSDAKILEIGAGTGGNIAMLEQFGEVQAVEMSDLARQIAWEKTGRDFLYGYLPNNIPISPETVDLICLFDVLEHVAEDEEVAGRHAPAAEAGRQDRAYRARASMAVEHA